MLVMAVEGLEKLLQVGDDRACRLANCKKTSDANCGPNIHAASSKFYILLFVAVVVIITTTMNSTHDPTVFFYAKFIVYSGFSKIGIMRKTRFIIHIQKVRLNLSYFCLQLFFLISCYFNLTDSLLFMIVR